jgi:hypothetical protein
MGLRGFVVGLCLVALPSFAQDGDPRPEGTAVGIGIGYAFPGFNVLQPNTASARFRLGGVVLEPRLNVGGSSTTGRDLDFSQTGDLPAEEDTVDTRAGGFGAGVGTGVRVPISSRGPVDLQFLGGVTVSYSTSSGDRDESDNENTDVSSANALLLNLDWGLGLEWFLGKGWGGPGRTRSARSRGRRTTPSRRPPPAPRRPARASITASRSSRRSG